MEIKSIFRIIKKDPHVGYVILEVILDSLGV